MTRQQTARIWRILAIPVYVCGESGDTNLLLLLFTLFAFSTLGTPKFHQIYIYIVLSLHLEGARHHNHNTQIARVKLLVLIDLLVCITYIYVSSSLHPMVKLKSFSRAKLNVLIILIRFINWGFFWEFIREINGME